VTGPAPASRASHDEAANEITEEEARAIASLQRLAKKWPRSLTLFSWSGSLAVYHTADTDRLVVNHDGNAEDLVLTWIEGIPNGGGDP
jgi:hypothetical protein